MRSALATLGLVVSLALVRAGGQTIQDPPVGRPDAVINLASHEGVQLVNGQWRYHDVKIEDADSRAVGPDLKPSGTPIRTYDYTPHAGPANFDDSQWEAIDATALDQRRSTAKVCFNWYRINITIPEKVANFSTAGSTVAFEIVIDDYAEVWVNGKMPRVLGQPGGPVIKGFNAPNRVIITRDAQPGQRIQLAVFGINGPISYSPQNFIWIKSATLDFYISPPKLRSVRLLHRSPERIQRWTRSFLLARRSRNWPEDSCLPRGLSGCRVRKTPTATFSSAIPITT